MMFRTDNMTVNLDMMPSKTVEEEMRKYSEKCQEQFNKNIAKRIRDKYKKEEQ